MSDRPDRGSTTVRVSTDVKADLDAIKNDRGYGTLSSTINQIMKENEQLRAEVDNLRTALGKIPDAD